MKEGRCGLFGRGGEGEERRGWFWTCCLRSPWGQGFGHVL